MKTININDFVWVRLNERGDEILARKGRVNRRKRKGWTEFQLHELMMIFGEFIQPHFNGCPFEPTLRLTMPEALTPKKPKA